MIYDIIAKEQRKKVHRPLIYILSYACLMLFIHFYLNKIYNLIDPHRQSSKYESWSVTPPSCLSSVTINYLSMRRSVFSHQLDQLRQSQQHQQRSQGINKYHLLQIQDVTEDGIHIARRQRLVILVKLE